MKKRTQKTAADIRAREIKIPSNAEEVFCASTYTTETTLWGTPAGDAFYLEHTVTFLDGKLLAPMSERTSPLEGPEPEKAAERKRRLREETTVTRMDARAALQWLIKRQVGGAGARKHFLAMLGAKGCYAITLTPELSREWDKASKRARTPIDWMIYNGMKEDIAEYLNPISGWSKDSRELWQEQRKRKVPIRVERC